MRNSRLQNQISESALTLPVCAVVAAVLWPVRCNPLSYDMGVATAVSLLAAVFTTYLIMETNSANSLLRIRSRMVSTVWVMGISMMTFAHDLSVTWLVVPLIAFSHYLLFRTYQMHEPVGYSFHIFFLLGTSILLIPQLCILVPLYFWYMAIFMRSLSWRALWAGIIGLTKSAAREMASRGICVNAVAPGFVDTDMVSAMGEEIKKKIVEKIPLGRIGQAAEIAEAVAFLAGDAAAYITGQVLCVDGGMAI